MSATKEELSAAMHRIADALRYMRGPHGEMIYVGEQIPAIAWHLARAGCDVHPERAVIKEWPLPDRPGQFVGMITWVPADYDGPKPEGVQPVSALAPDIDLDALDAALPWHTKTRIEGDFS